MKLKVSSNNFYVGNKRPREDARLLASEDCDISGIQEAHGGNLFNIKTELRKTHKVLYRSVKNRDRNMAFGEVPVVVPNGLNVIKSWSRLVSRRAQKKNIGMPRAATAVRFKKNDKTVTFINTHLNAAVRGSKGNHLSVKIKRVSEYVASIVILEIMIRNAKRRGDLVVLVGDLNYRVVGFKPWKFSPQALFKRTNMRFISRGLDYIAYSPEFVAGRLEVIGPANTGSDHPWLFLTLTTN